ncbi:MAG TPA: 16S rRNA (guanine(966)-N(2))-methyltransferase RsmD [Candidatus Saccharimonadales bacterium]|nr:16S rRNA (guanine(966)-N(2))-methyltransferase RsmD [Candidatus Saccharimonadales bacterium]
MRIIAGNLKGREFKSPRGHKTHPMSEKVRGALFNVLGDIEGLTILDAFTGSGALAFEAASRGAGSVAAIEKDRSAHTVAVENVKSLGLGATVKVVRANAAGWSIHNLEKKFDVVLLDPPFEDLQANLLATLVKRHVKPEGLAVLNYPGHQKAPAFYKTKQVIAKNYGDTQLVFYRKIR